jgi:Cytochrome P460
VNRRSMLTIGIATVWLAALGNLAISAQDKYTVKVPGGLAFSEFKGYESWQAISLSRNEKVVAMILGNPVMIDAYQAGIPANGKPVPDGAKMAKIHWIPKQNQFFPEATVPGNGERRQVRVRVPHESEGGRLRVYGVREALTVIRRNYRGFRNAESASGRGRSVCGHRGAADEPSRD